MTDKKSHILIVEDDFALNDAFQLILQHGGFSTTAVHNGKEALEYLAGKTRPDLIILDILMPIMDGREFLRHFDNQTLIPILALSNLDAKSDIESLYEKGVTRYALKSNAEPVTLINLVNDMLDAARASKKST